MTTSSPPQEIREGSWASVLAGDPDGFGRLSDTYRHRVFWHALQHTRAVHDAEDIAALVFLEAWRKRASVRLVDGSPLPWLLATTNNVARNAGLSRTDGRRRTSAVVPRGRRHRHGDRHRPHRRLGRDDRRLRSLIVTAGRGSR